MSDLFTATTTAQIEEVLARGEDIEEERGSLFTKTTPLISACERGEFEVVECLLNHGADPNHCPPFKCKPIRVASQEGHAAIAELLIRAGADINDNGGGEGSTALIIASLLSLGADTETRDWDGKTALMATCSGGKVDVVDRLLAAGCNVNAVDQHHISSLMKAAREGHVTIFDRIVVHGADFNHQDKWGSNVLMWASMKGHTEAVDRLLSLGCDVNVQAEDGMTALMLACFQGKIEIVRLLLDHGADPLICDIDGQRFVDLVAASSPEIKTLLNGLFLLSFHTIIIIITSHETRIDPKPKLKRGR